MLDSLLEESIRSVLEDFRELEKECFSIVISSIHDSRIKPINERHRDLHVEYRYLTDVSSDVWPELPVLRLSLPYNYRTTPVPVSGNNGLFPTTISLWDGKERNYDGYCFNCNR